VVSGKAKALDPLAWHPDNVEDWEAVRTAAHDTVEGRELADAIRCRQDCRAVNPRISICRIGCVQLVGVAYPIKSVNFFNRIVDRKGVVAYFF
jgi:hypothetical protein